MDEIKQKIREELENADNRFSYLNELNEFIRSIHPNSHNPVSQVHWVHIDRVQANDYNPNSVAIKELRLLYTSISHDGYTQPVVTIYDSNKDKYIIIDGFHRYFTMKSNKDLLEKNNNYLPIVVLDKDINDRMASTVRHNRARGKHSVDGMSNIVFNMLDNGWTDADVCKEMGMEMEELIRLKHITGFSKLFEDVEYQKAWKAKKQIQLEKQYKSGSTKRI